jgi:hypothetical protein
MSSAIHEKMKDTDTADLNPSTKVIEIPLQTHGFSLGLRSETITGNPETAGRGASAGF